MRLINHHTIQAHEKKNTKDKTPTSPPHEWIQKSELLLQDHSWDTLCAAANAIDVAWKVTHNVVGKRLQDNWPSVYSSSFCSISMSSGQFPMSDLDPVSLSTDMRTYYCSIILEFGGCQKSSCHGYHPIQFNKSSMMCRLVILVSRLPVGKKSGHFLLTHTYPSYRIIYSC